MPQSAAALAPADPALHWPASLQLTLAPGPRGNRLVGNRHQGPLYVQKPFYPEGPEVAHLYLLHPPGGMVSGDHLHIGIDQQPQGHCLLTTPGATRIYRARADRSLQQQQVRIEVGAGASVEWLPMETLIYPGAATALHQDIHLSASARFIGWEITCFGLPACHQPFEDGQYLQTLRIHHDDRLVLHDRLRVSGSRDPHSLLNQSIGLAGRPVNGLFVAGPFETLVLDELRAGIDRIQGVDQAWAGLTLQRHFLLARYLGQRSEQCRALFVALWQQVRPLLLARNACAPRIWFT